MVCFRKMSVKLNSLESIWYCVFTLTVTICLCLDGIRHYQHYNTLEWPEGKPKAELDLHVLCTLASFLIILLFVPTQIFKVGNRANDQGKLGFMKDWVDNGNRRDEGSQSEKQIRRIRKYILAVRKVTKHLGPVGATLHIISAFCLLMPLMFLQARAIQYGLLSSGSIWRSEVSVVSTHYAQKMVGLTDEDVQSEGAFLPAGMHTPSMLPPPNDAPGKYFPTGQESLESVPIHDPFKVYMVTLNYINYVIPLFLYAIRYADVFWLCHKGFAFFFCAQLMLNATQYALGFIGISLLYKLHWYGWDKYGVPREPVFDKATGLIGCYLTNNITVFLSAVVTYTYGYGRLKQAEQKVKMQGEHPVEIFSAGFAMKCNGFVSHIGALLVLIIFICCKTPLMVEYLAVYQISKDARLLGVMVFDVIYMVSWLLLWIGFGIKRKWDFKISHPSPVSQLVQSGDPDASNNSWNSRYIHQAIPLNDLDMDGYPGSKHDTMESILEKNPNNGTSSSSPATGDSGEDYNDMADGDLSKSGQYQQLRSVDPDSASVHDCLMSSDQPTVTPPHSARKRHSFSSSLMSTPKHKASPRGEGDNNSLNEGEQSLLGDVEKSGRSTPEDSPLLEDHQQGEGFRQL